MGGRLKDINPQEADRSGLVLNQVRIPPTLDPETVNVSPGEHDVSFEDIAA